jgi:hypothetical protein
MGVSIMFLQNIEDPIGTLIIGLIMATFGGIVFVIGPRLRLWYAEVDEALGCILMAQLMKSRPMRILYPIVSRIGALIFILVGLWVVISVILAI